ncbi:hypothetical protein SAMN02745857_02750 [Andreprevotia lacus DSM 23236]|jgi:hypothetical protein|uniref:Uncharacterized protein n=1 Tax=Andreprevotia lacus DSM 23236 TaxID=1121001 RepID=A0A1W1XUK4_9NEIS|nr:hypothetical protein [Andreprevotia lacus]SMC27198.1 hypothetical protein SAMN02745857_02750 [Andreprevotia lacus DSM 23236]
MASTPDQPLNPVIGSQARNDWNNYWDNSKSGDTQSWAGGTLTRNADGSATFSSGGKDTTFSRATSMESLAAGNANIAGMWGNQYGTTKTEPLMTVDTKLNFSPESGYQSAMTRGVSADELTSNQLGKVLSADSPVIQQARRLAMEQANGRGLLNSSIAAGAGTEAAIGQAINIASADAGAYQTAANANQNALNQFGLAKNQGLINAQLTGIQGDYNLRNQKQQQEFTAGQNTLDREQKQSQFQQTYDQTQRNYDKDYELKQKQFEQQVNQANITNELARKTLAWQIKYNIASFNASKMENYLNAVQNIQLSNIDNKDDAVRNINKLIFGNAEATGKYPYSLDALDI